MPDDPYKYFRVEARDLLDAMTQETMQLANGAPTPAVIAAVLRHAHTLKGAARVVRQGEIAEYAHAIEEALEPFRQSADPIPRGPHDAIVQFLEAAADRVSDLPSPGPTSAAPMTRVPGPDRHHAVIRTELTDIDLLFDGVVQARTALNGIRQTSDDIAGLPTTPSGGRDVAEPPDDAVHAGLIRGLREGIGRLDRDLRQLGDLVERVRLVPAAALFPDLERAMRDVAQAQGKRVVFHGHDGGVRLDAHVASVALTALQQIVRNAVAHGIETVPERSKAGKTDPGHVTVHVARRGRSIVFTCVDDGRGIDLDAVKQAAYRKGIDAGRINDLGPEELTLLLLKGGISTAAEVTELSGRGIGLDIVRESAEFLHGQIRVVTETDKGTTVELEVPLALASFQALGLTTGSAVAYLPLDAVIETFQVVPEEIQPGTHGPVLAHQGAVLPFLDLATALMTPPSPRLPSTRWSVMVVEGRRGRAAVGGHRFIQISNIVVRPLPTRVRCTPAVAGLWIDAEGTPQLVLDPDELVTEAQRQTVAPHVSPVLAALPILVVDDSLTTRMLEQSILESAGYEVDVASSGEEGLTKARRTAYQIFLVDVEMPGMDGFTFIESAKADPLLRNVPAILITSCAHPDDLARGVAAGASAYLTKGEFDQGSLLAHIQTLSAH